MDFSKELWLRRIKDVYTLSGFFLKQIRKSSVVHNEKELLEELWSGVFEPLNIAGHLDILPYT